MNHCNVHSKNNKTKNGKLFLKYYNTIYHVELLYLKEPHQVI